MLRLESLLLNIIGMSIENALSLFDIMKKITQGKARKEIIPLTQFMSDCPFKSETIPGGWDIASAFAMPILSSVRPASTR